MNIHEIPQKIKSGGGLDILIVTGLILCVGIIAFCLGRLSVLPEDHDSPSVKIIMPNLNTN